MLSALIYVSFINWGSEPPDKVNGNRIYIVIAEQEGKATNLATQVAKHLYICIYICLYVYHQCK